MFGLWRKWISYPIWWAVIVGGFAIALALASGAGRTYADMESFHGDYTLSPSGNNAELQVTETIAVKLNNERGIFRDLVTTYGKHELLYYDFKVTNADGYPIDFRRTTKDNGDIELRIGDGSRISGLRTYKISYRMFPAVVGNQNYQELYFNVNGTEWPNGFKRVTATVRVDESLAPGLNGLADCYTGRAGSTERCQLVNNDLVWSVDAGRLGPYENVTIAIGFEPGTVDVPLPPFSAASLSWTGIAITAGIGLAALLLALAVRYIVGNLRVGETGVVTQFDPPEDLPPVLAADFLGTPERGAAAHLAWLVTQGHGKLTGSENPETAPGPDRDDLAFGIRNQFRDDIKLEWSREGMRADTRRITELLFGPEKRPTPIGRYRRQSGLYAAQEYRDDVLQHRHLRHTLGLNGVLLWIGFLALTGFGVYQVWRGLAGLGWWFILANAVSFILLMWAVHLLPVHGGLTKRGRQVRRHLMGLERFITMSEANRIAWLQNAQDAPREDGRVKLYEKLLPWAIVFGVERSWGQLVGDMYSRFPDVQLPEFSLLSSLSDADNSMFRADRDYYTDSRRSGQQASFFASRDDIGHGAASQGWGEFWSAVGEAASGRGSDDSSTRGSGRGWSGGGSSSSFSGGSGGGGFSGGGTGGGGGGRW